MVGLAIPGMSHYIATKMGIIGFMRGFPMTLQATELQRIRCCRSDEYPGNRASIGRAKTRTDSAGFGGLPDPLRRWDRRSAELLALRSTASAKGE